MLTKAQKDRRLRLIGEQHREFVRKREAETRAIEADTRDELVEQGNWNTGLWPKRRQK